MDYLFEGIDTSDPFWAEIKELWDELTRIENEQGWREGGRQLLEKLHSEATMTLFVFCNGKCIGKKDTIFFKAQGENGLAMKFYKAFREKGFKKIRVIGQYKNGDQVLFHPLDASLIGDIKYFEENPERYNWTKED